MRENVTIDSATKHLTQVEEAYRAARREYETAVETLRGLLRLTGPGAADQPHSDPLAHADARVALPDAERRFHLTDAALKRSEREFENARNTVRDVTLVERRPARRALVAALAKKVKDASVQADRLREHDAETTSTTGHQMLAPWPELLNEGYEARVDHLRKDGWL